MRKRVLVIGATGVFGKRLARHLSAFPELDLVVSSRDAGRARALAAELRSAGSAASVDGVAIDHREGFAQRLRELKPWAVIDCSGPFQGAGYAVAKDILSAGAHAIDLADARDYLVGYREALDDIALKNGVAGLAGASSTPALSSAVVNDLSTGLRRIDTIDICITPGGRSEVGRSAVEGILSYAGVDIPVWQQGQLSSTSGWTGSKKIVVPGLGTRRVAPVETIDAELLGPRHNVGSRAMLSAGLESRLEQIGIAFLARLRRAGIIPDLGFLVPLLLASRKVTRLTTSDRGGMVVDVTGLADDGALRRKRWSLLAVEGDGLFVPVLPAAAAIRGLLNGDIERGANLAGDCLTLAQIESEMGPHGVSTTVDRFDAEDGAIGRAIGRQNFDDLPPALRAFHDQSGEPVWRGKADIDTGNGLVAWFFSRLFGFPAAGRSVPVCVTVDRELDSKANAVPVETWTRNFDGRRFSSRLHVAHDGKFTETFDPFVFEIGITGGRSGITMPIRSWSVAGVKLPAFLAPRSEAREYEDDLKRFRFDVKLSLPLFGTLAHYRGWLEPQEVRSEGPVSHESAGHSGA